MSVYVNVVFGFLFCVAFLIGLYRTLTGSAERNAVAKKLAEAIAVNVRLQEALAQNELLRKQDALQKEELRCSHMRESTYRILSVGELGDLLLLARQLSVDPVIADACDTVLLCCMAISERHIVLRREGHSDVHAVLRCFENGDPAQIQFMLVGLRMRRLKDFASIMSRFPKSVERFFRRLMDEEPTNAEVI